MKTVSGFSQRNPYSPIVVSKLWLSNLSFHFRLHSLAKNAMPKQLPQDNEPKLQTNTYTLNNKFTKPFGCHPKKNCATLHQKISCRSWHGRSTLPKKVAVFPWKKGRLPLKGSIFDHLPTTGPRFGQAMLHCGGGMERKLEMSSWYHLDVSWSLKGVS